uniref:Transposase n=1 Tax=Candidatus Kentrum sp. TC TaxID=2126339 RepID=A0A451AH52_9GAMM|nr:MAG: Transposase [Candidatus Kentron sp. TC]
MGYLNAVVLKVGNGLAEGINSCIKALEIKSRGFRNKQRFANAIYFHPTRHSRNQKSCIFENRLYHYDYKWIFRDSKDFFDILFKIFRVRD